MNKLAKTTICRLLPLLFVSVMLSACVNTLELAVPRGVERASVTHEGAVADAKAYFDTHFGNYTRSEEQQPTPEAPYVVGNLVPDWESGVTIANEEKTQSDFAMQKDFRYLLLLDEDDAGQLQAVELYSRFVSVEDIENGIMSQYVATYIPSEEYLSSYGAVAQDYGINCSENYEFSGVVLYTLPSGHHVAAYRYADGELVKGSFLYDSEQTTDENIADFMAVMEGLQIGVGGVQDGTRSDAIYGGTSKEIVFVYNTIFPIIIIDNTYSNPWDDDNQMVEPFDHYHIVLGGGGGGGDSHDVPEGGEEEDEPTGEEMAKEVFENYATLSDSVKQILNDAMQKIIEDCMGKTLADSVKSKGMTFKYNTSYSSSNYDYANNDLIYNGDGVDALLHEMVHAYQYNSLYQQNKSNCDEVFESAMANYEIEAQVARINYYKRNHDTSSNDWENQFYLGDDNTSLLLLSVGVDDKGNLKSGITDRYLDLYIGVATFFESALGYTYDASQVLHYDNIVKLSENC